MLIHCARVGCLSQFHIFELLALLCPALCFYPYLVLTMARGAAPSLLWGKECICEDPFAHF